MDNSKIQDIITKSILDEASSDELVILENWRRESDNNENLYQDYASIWNASANYTPKDFQPNTESAYKKHLDLLSNEEANVVQMTTDIPNRTESSPNTINPKPTQIFTLKRLANLAAILVFVLGAMVVFNTMSNTSISAEDGVVFASLEDGTSIWLDEGSTLSYSKGFGKKHRDVTIKGKAFFDVQRNEAIPFNISSNDINVSVLGTSFTVDNTNGKNIVAVKTGTVAVKAGDKSVTLLADDKVKFENDNFIKQTISLEDIAWRNTNLSFNNAPLNQVISDINLFHDNKIILVQDIQNLDCPFTARSLANTSFENIIEILKVTYDLDTELKDNGTVALTISDCK